uniref:glucan 1,4-alpha-glucosidase n=1 Tax=Megaviridae environmental sample TaxID=1737588 RepID=A0A5J6VJQ0_9VIRU|nr:MAG: glycosyl hydrolase family 15 [Megaviridae environmental sample]
MLDKKIILNKILNNIRLTSNGSIVASPTKNNPNYFYHWIRDSALTMKVIIKEYELTSNPVYLDIILKYVNYEYNLQKLNSLSGLGEPKYNTNTTTFNDSWGRPQNDGPALRSTNMINISRLLKSNFNNVVEKMIEPIIEKDLEYVLANYDKQSFDLWEEKHGYHFYTRIVQAKFLKEAIKYFERSEYKQYLKNLLELIKHHFDSNFIISSFDCNGSILRIDDSSIFMGIVHIDFDEDIVPLNKYYLIQNNINSLLQYFNEKYNGKYNFIGRYKFDEYFNGQSWIICTINMLTFFKHLKVNQNISNKILDQILTINPDLNLNEQYDPKEKKQYSVEQLTWNYTEMYLFISKV